MVFLQKHKVGNIVGFKLMFNFLIDINKDVIKSFYDYIAMKTSI